MSDPFFAIVNPTAGGGRCGRGAQHALDQLGPRVSEVVHTREAGEAQRLAEEAVRRGVRNLLAVGGDGTALEVLNGALDGEPLAETDPSARAVTNPADDIGGTDSESRPLRLSVLPLGTGNSLVQHFSSPGEPLLKRALRGILENRETIIDLIAVDHAVSRTTQRLHALSSVTFGLPTRVASFVNRHLKWMGQNGYTASAVFELLRLKQDEYEATCQPPQPLRNRTPMLFVQNTSTVGGAMLIAPGAEIDDGQLDLIWAEPANRLSMLRAFPRVFSGTHISHPAFRQAKVQELAFASPREGLVMLDGDVKELAVKRVSVAPRALRLAL